jgi:predicted phosphohydrolase
MRRKKIVWITDPHLNFLDQRSLIDFLEAVSDSSPDVLLLSGDVSDAPNLIRCLKVISDAIDGQVYFVLGNHDYYKGSILEVNKKVKALVKKDNKLNFLDDLGPVKLNNGTALIGHSGWYDGRNGDYKNTKLSLRDFLLIEELYLEKGELLKKINELADKAAKSLKEKLIKAIESGFKNILCITHVPPFKEAAWHMGKQSDKDALPFFSSKIMGEALKPIMKKNPKVKLTIFCGHTHSKGKYSALPNLEVITGEAEYEFPKIQSIRYV